MDLKFKNLLLVGVMFFAMAGISFASANDPQTLSGHVAKIVSLSNQGTSLDSNQTLSVNIVLPMRNQDQLNSLLKHMYTRKDPAYHQFLKTADFQSRFAPVSPDVDYVKNYLINQGFKYVSTSRDNFIIKMTATPALLNKTFGVQLYNYTKDSVKYFSTKVDPKVPMPMVGKIAAIGGLNNVAIFQGHFHKLNSLGKNTVNKNAVTPKFGSGPGGFLGPQDVSKAYNFNSIPAKGIGQTVALFELDGYYPSDVSTYQRQFGLSNVPLQNVLIDGFNGLPSGTGGSAEVTLDIELVAAFAQGLSSIMVYEAPNSWQAWSDEWHQIANDNIAKSVSCSWGLSEDLTSAPVITDNQQIFAQMAAQGQSVFIAAGDNGAYDNGYSLSVDEPAAEPMVTGVGISKLSVTSTGAYSSETASLYGGGGISGVEAIPSYQQGMISQASLGSTSNRNVPDVALTADPATGYAFYISGAWNGYWGSSLAAPIWAAFTALVNQSVVPLNQNGAGFINPLIYQIAQSGNFANDFHNITTGNNSFYPAGPGYSDATGLGSMNALNLYNDLVAMSSSAPAAPANFSATAGNGQVALSWSVSSGALSYNVKRLNGNSYTTIASKVTSTSYADTTVAGLTSYTYVVSAVNGVGESSDSSPSTVTTPAITIPNAPTGLTATANNSNVALAWTASSGAVWYNVKRSTVNPNASQKAIKSMAAKPKDSFTVIATVNGASYTDSSLASGTYYYKVTAGNSAGESADSNVAQTSVQSPEDIITGLYASILKRQPDYEGFAYWVQNYKNGTPLSYIQSAFTNSPENARRLAGLKTGYEGVTLNSTATDLINGFYQNFFGHKASTNQMNFWMMYHNWGIYLEFIRQYILWGFGPNN